MMVFIVIFYYLCQTYIKYILFMCSNLYKITKMYAKIYYSLISSNFLYLLQEKI